MSLDTAIQYKHFVRKEIGALITPGASGWRVNLLFPKFGQSWEGADTVLLVMWGAIAGVLAAFAVRHARHKTDLFLRPARDRMIGAALVGLLGMATARAGVAAVRGAESAYWPDHRDARMTALLAFARIPRCGLWYESSTGAWNLARLLGNEPGRVGVEGMERHSSGGVVWLRIRPRTRAGECLLDDVALDFGTRYLIRVDVGWEGTAVSNTIEVDVRRLSS